MSENGKALSEESFEFIETPPAAQESAPAPNCGVKTTNVGVTDFQEVAIIGRCAEAAIGSDNTLHL